MKWCKMPMAFILVLALLATLCLGCGEKAEEKATINVGFLSVYTGMVAPALSGLNYTVEALVRHIEEEDPIPGVKIKLISFDERYEPARDVPGYDWCMERGAKVILTPVPPCAEVLKPFAERDKVPVFTWAATPPMIEPPGWVFCLGAYFPRSISTLLEWLSQEWPNYPTKPKIGSYGWAEPAEISGNQAVKQYCQDHPDEFEYVADVLVPLGAMFTSGEIEKLKDCDYMFTAGANAAVLGFLRDFRARGYTATWLSTDAFASVRGLALDMCGWEALDGTLVAHPTRWWGEPYPLVELAEELLYRYYPDKAEDITHAGIAYIGAFQQVYTFFDILREAVQEVGAENLDGQAFYDAATKFETTYEGYPKWGFTETQRYGMDRVAVYEWKAEVGDLVKITDWLPAVE